MVLKQHLQHTLENGTLAEKQAAIRDYADVLDEDVVALLLPLLTDPNLDRFAARTLADADDPQIAPAVLNRFKTEPSCIASFSTSLSKLGATAAIPDLIAALNNPATTDNDKYYVIRALGKLKANEAIPHIEKYVQVNKACTGKNKLLHAAFWALRKIEA